MDKMTYTTCGTCSRAINIELDGDIVRRVEFVGGCHGNTQGIASLVAGMRADDVVAEHFGCLRPLYICHRKIKPEFS